jgi:hypothetical protein
MENSLRIDYLKFKLVIPGNYNYSFNMMNDIEAYVS